ncbi:MAG: hypothetical protein WBE13_09050, partial [Candidatus Acidiferrum sp.]
GCAPPYKKAFDDAAQEHGWSHDQELAAFAYADRIFWAHETSEGSGVYVILYSRVPTSAVDKQLATILTDFDQSLDPKNTDMKQYVETFGLKKEMEHEEAVTEVIYTRVHAANLEYQFQQDMGQLPTSGDEARLAAGYNAKKIFLAKDVAAAFPFKSDQIEAAKANGTLKPIENVELVLNRKLDHKDTDLSHPDDTSAFVWKPKRESIRLTNYKIIDTEKPTDNNGNYIEGYRVVDDKQESLPCIKVFFPNGGSGAVVLLDKDRQGEPGYGVPDILETMAIASAEDIVRTDSILDTLFVEKKTEKRLSPPNKLFQIEISRINGPESPWEKAPNSSGWDVPFKYVNSYGTNYNIRIKFKDPVVDPNDPDAVAKAHSGYQDIQYIEKEYTKSGDSISPSPGQVIEYYHAKSGFATQVKASVLSTEDTKKVEFLFPDGTETDGYVTPGSNKFIDAKPYAKSYTEGEKRWLIEKSEGSDIYDKRKLISPPKEATGIYEDEDDQSIRTQVGGASPTGPNDIKVKKPQ